MAFFVALSDVTAQVLGDFYLASSWRTAAQLRRRAVTGDGFNALLPV